ncbi:pullulanase [Paenibacillus sp. CAA11]|uniref:DUF6509 family protein n=1 Tax=Paenibacillus sp. CAA11 TaxID=1532905 RepID=UPI000D340D4F|nr:DUF6509 family protein [Paenibacillus sp. CAA11]AWB46483.1 pullulanase [Paenibacillus sp. CAA11]
MITFKSYSAELVKDPFGILSGQRYEFIIDLDIPEEDELYMENGVYARVVVKEDEGGISIIKYDLMERSTDKMLDFDLEEEEESALEAFCKEHLPGA